MACEYHFQQSQDNPSLSYSRKIDRVISFIERKLRFDVKLFDYSLEENENTKVMGRTWYQERKISINCHCAGCAVIVLLHEAGHAISDLAKLLDSINGAKKAEPLADMFGRHLGKVLNLDISEEDWIIHKKRSVKIGYREDQDGSEKSECCGNCQSYVVKLVDEDDRKDLPCSFCNKHELFVCATNGTCGSFSRKG